MHALKMLPTSLVALTASFLVPLIAASSAPVCVSSHQGYATGQVNYLYNNFCQTLADNKFQSDMSVYGMPVISFSFASTSGAGFGTCNQNNCLASYKTLVASCGMANQTIWGTGSINAGCGTYNFTIWDTAKNPITLGKATTTLVGATMTTAATIITSSSTVSSTSSQPTLIENTVLSTSTGSSSIEPSDLTSSSLLPSVTDYVNSTSPSYVAVSTTAQSTAVAVSKTSSQSASKTSKPDVGSTALGTSGGGIIRVSGLSLVAVACLFVGFF